MFTVKEYQYSTPFRGKAEEAFKVARTSLLSLGFEITESSKHELHATGPGMHSNQQPALVGVSRLKLHIDSSSITATAQLGGVSTMKNFVYIFPPALVLVLLVTFSLLGMEISWLYILLLLPWFVIAPWMARMMERKTTDAVDRLVRGMAQST